MNKPIMNYLYSINACFTDTPTNGTIPLRLIQAGQFEDVYHRSSASFSRQIEQAGFEGKDKQVCILRDDQGAVVEILVGISLPLSLYAFSVVFEQLRGAFSSAFLKTVAFKIDGALSPEDCLQASIGWGLASYRFDIFKKEKSKAALPVLVWPEGVDKGRVTAMVEALCLIKNLINMPSNHLGTDELADAAAQIAKYSKASFSRIVDKDLIEKNFPMIYGVGRSSPRRPQLVEINWGNDAHTPITLVGKGIVFDTGGLDIKPPPFMIQMKKDMGGAAHVLAIAHVIMSLNLPVRLRVLLSIAENSVSGESFRPGDIMASRKGLSVEIGDTDAEGRLVVGDALAYACESDPKPSLVVDFCTLTGSARAALGYDIPAFFSNRDSILDELRDIGMKHEDPIWPLPLWQPYLKEMNSSVADINNIGSGKAGAIHGGLFLQQFIDASVDWVHMDCYAWEQSGKPGRPQGGADTGMRAVLKFIERRIAA